MSESTVRMAERSPLLRRTVIESESRVLGYWRARIDKRPGVVQASGMKSHAILTACCMYRNACCGVVCLRGLCCCR